MWAIFFLCGTQVKTKADLADISGLSSWANRNIQNTVHSFSYVWLLLYVYELYDLFFYRAAALVESLGEFGEFSRVKTRLLSQEGSHGVIWPAAFHAEGLHLLLSGRLHFLQAVVWPLPLIQLHYCFYMLHPFVLCF